MGGSFVVYSAFSSFGEGDRHGHAGVTAAVLKILPVGGHRVGGIVQPSRASSGISLPGSITDSPVREE